MPEEPATQEPEVEVYDPDMEPSPAMQELIDKYDAACRDWASTMAEDTWEDFKRKWELAESYRARMYNREPKPLLYRMYRDRNLLKVPVLPVRSHE